MTTTIPHWGTHFQQGKASPPPEWMKGLPSADELAQQAKEEKAVTEKARRADFLIPEDSQTQPQDVTPDPEPVKAPLTLSHSTDAYCIVIRSSKPPEGDSWTWWTPDALDSEEWDDRNGNFQVGYSLKTPVWLEEVDGRNPPKPKVVRFYKDMAHALAKMHGGQVLEEFKNPDAPHTRFTIHNGRNALFDLKEIRGMTMTQQDLSRAGGKSRSPKKIQAVSKNLEGARDVTAKAAAQRYERTLRLLDAGVTEPQIALGEGISLESAKRLTRRAREWKASQDD